MGPSQSAKPLRGSELLVLMENAYISSSGLNCSGRFQNLPLFIPVAGFTAPSPTRCRKEYTWYAVPFKPMISPRFIQKCRGNSKINSSSEPINNLN